MVWYEILCVYGMVRDADIIFARIRLAVRASFGEKQNLTASMHIVNSPQLLP